MTAGQHQDDLGIASPTPPITQEDKDVVGEDETPPPLPPRPSPSLLDVVSPSIGGSPGARPKLQSRATTAVSSVDIQTQSFPDGTRATYSTAAVRSVSDSASSQLGYSTPNRKDPNGSDIDDAASVMSIAPTLRAHGDLASLLDEQPGARSPAWKALSAQADSNTPVDSIELSSNSLLNFGREFDGLYELGSAQASEEELLGEWKNKYKHYLILSSAGKPIYSRHGDLNLINGYIGIIQTIISFFQDSGNVLAGFQAGSTRFVVSMDGPLYFVAISRLDESDAQLRAQLEALYMQILSTLTLPTLNQLFTNRPNTDLRRPLEGTETLLSSLADTFTKGSPSTLLSALECLKMRKTHRTLINNTLLKARTPKLLYGLIVAGGRLVSVVRPKRHSLHPSDLQLIFNMLFEADGVKAGGGENWIPMCLPGFNKNGYLYMYVSFLSTVAARGTSTPRMDSVRGQVDKGIAILLISADKESFYDLQQMRDEVVEQLEKNGSMKIIRDAVARGRLLISDIAPGSSMSHFIYKSRANVQLVVSSFTPAFETLLARRRLLTIYHALHASIHARHAHQKIVHSTATDSTALAWSTPTFEFYAVAPPGATRAALARAANRVVQWLRREEERVFIIGGAVF